ncbi:Selenocysteine-specific elongation factor [Camelus dromedarius]|uniref:Selenocysteine-specific elongation factor n=1 Tax=Camelus dromedarius TaxID=9838 RepID=A0A5N4D0B7_CAMDR|nr:Selenocysteine-specific elongation factor [Camelus dromedarius]
MRAGGLNVNVGVLGHIDSGKTAAGARAQHHGLHRRFDKQPQSRERGITLDLASPSLVDHCPRSVVSVRKRSL